VLPLTASRYATASFLSIEVRPGRPAAGLYRMREPTPCAENGIASFDRIRQRRRRGGHNRNGLAHAAVEATEAAATEAARGRDGGVRAIK
jgi:hypothetical protein